MSTSIFDKDPSFESLSNFWLEQRKLNLKYSYKNENYSMVRHIIKHIGDKKVADISPADIDVMVAALSADNPNTHKPASKSFLDKLVNITRSIFDMAVDNHIITVNPIRSTKQIVPKNAPKKDVTAISREQQELIVNTPHRCQTAALIMMLAGLRVSELLALEWCNVDLKNGLLRVTQHAVRVDSNKFAIESATKNGHCRCVPIPSVLAIFLLHSKKNAISPLVFPKTDGNLNTPSSWKSAWTSYMNTLNYEYYTKEFPGISKFDPNGYPKMININPHQLRHTYATLHYEAGTDPLTTSKLLGHSGVQLTLDTYTHLDEQYKKLDISNFNNFLTDEFCNNKELNKQESNTLQAEQIDTKK